MVMQDFFEKVGELKDRFFGLFQQHKKLKALENYSEGETRFGHRSYLTLVKKCMSDGFLGDEEAKFLDHMLCKYEVNYLDWHHRTKWVKSEIFDKKRERNKEIQTVFNFDKVQKGSPINIPTHILPKVAQRGLRA
jgi:hypothetical protein